METMGAKIKELTAHYTEQLKLYKRIQEVGLQEKGLIAQGRFALLLEVLKEKGELMKEASGYDAKIKAGQADVARHFGLDSFSLPRLKHAAPAAYRKEVGGALQAVVAELVPVLEDLEEQERRNEALLGEFLEQANDPGGIKRWREMRAGRAYGRKKTQLDNFQTLTKSYQLC